MTEAHLRTGVLAILRHEGYTDEEIAAVEAAESDHTPACWFEPMTMEWSCVSEEGTPNHPVADRMRELSELLQVADEAMHGGPVRWRVVRHFSSIIGPYEPVAYRVESTDLMTQQDARALAEKVTR